MTDMTHHTETAPGSQSLSPTVLGEIPASTELLRQAYLDLSQTQRRVHHADVIQKIIGYGDEQSLVSVLQLEQMGVL